MDTLSRIMVVLCAYHHLGELAPEASQIAVCHCLKTRGECPDCKHGFNEEVAAGRPPKFVKPGDVVPEDSTTASYVAYYFFKCN